MTRHHDWGFGDFFRSGFGPPPWARGAGARTRGRRRQQFFESGELKFVILRLLKEKPRHGYEIIKALEEKLGGCYTPSPGAVYPTLQLLEDQGYIKATESEGRKVYQITPDGEAYLAEHRDLLEDILARVRETVSDLAGGTMGDLNASFGRMAGRVYKEAWRRGPGDPSISKAAEVLRRAAEEIERIFSPEAGSSEGTP